MILGQEVSDLLIFFGLFDEGLIVRGGLGGSCGAFHFYLSCLATNIEGGADVDDLGCIRIGVMQDFNGHNLIVGIDHL